MNALHGKNGTFFEDCLLYSGLQIHSNVCLTLFLFYRNSVFTTLKYLQTYPPSLKSPQYVHLIWKFSCWTQDVHFIAVCYVTKDTWRPTRSNQIQAQRKCLFIAISLKNFLLWKHHLTSSVMKVTRFCSHSIKIIIKRIKKTFIIAAILITSKNNINNKILNSKVQPCFQSSCSMSFVLTQHDKQLFFKTLSLIIY